MTGRTPRELRQLRDGDYAHTTGVRCPRDCGGEVVYNGNYFCERWAYRGVPPRPLAPDECDWALGATNRWEADELYGGRLDPVDVRVWRELRRDYGPLRAYLTDHPEEDEP